MNPNDATLMYDQPQTPKNNQEPLVISNESQSESPIATDEQPKSESEHTPAQPPKNQTLKSAGVSAAAGAVGGAVAGLGVQYADNLVDKAGDAVETVEGWLGLNDSKEEATPVPGAEPGGDPNAPTEPQNTLTDNEPNAPAEPQNVAHNPTPQPQEPAQPQQTEEPVVSQTEQGTPLDTNQDGVTDAVALDQNHDGVVDAIAIDQDQDGTIDAMILDQDQDGYADGQLVDANHDGVVDGALVDSDGDHDLDTIVVDTNHDGQFSEADQTQAMQEDLTIELTAHDQPGGEAITDTGEEQDYDNDGPVEDWA